MTPPTRRPTERDLAPLPSPEAFASEVAEQIRAQGVDLELASYSQLLDAALHSIRHGTEDSEMLARAELKTRFRVSDEQINTALFKRHGESKVQHVEATHDTVQLAEIQPLEYIMDGWIPKGDISLTYGAYGTGKTTLAVWKAYHLAQGRNILDRSTPCTPGRSLIIATDSGAAALKKSMLDVGIDPDSDPLFQPGRDQMIWIWAYAPEQGHSAWTCTIHGVIRLERFIEEHGIAYVAIDSAKSVSSAAGWSYTSNESVKALLKHLREGVCAPTGACIDLLSHDGTEKGSHSGAKAWAEDPSMVCHLTVQKDPDSGQESVTAQFKKDRAAAIDPRRQVSYFLDDQQLKLAPLAEVVGRCDEAILTVLWDAYLGGEEVLSVAALADRIFARFTLARKTVENSLPGVTGTGKGAQAKPVIRKGRGKYALAPHEIQRRQATTERQARAPSPPPNRALYEMGGGISRSPAPQGVCLPPMTSPGSGERGKRIPPPSPSGGTVGGTQNPVAAGDLQLFPPDGGSAPLRKTAHGRGADAFSDEDDPAWGPRPVT